MLDHLSNFFDLETPLNNGCYRVFTRIYKCTIASHLSMLYMAKDDDQLQRQTIGLECGLAWPYKAWILHYPSIGKMGAPYVK